jgi:hypothetical protein
MNNMESRIPLKKQYRKKYASWTIRYNSHGKIMAEESDSRQQEDACKNEQEKATKKSNKNLFLLIQWMLLWMNLTKRKRTVSIRKKKSIDKQEKSPFEDTTNNESE